MYICRDPHCSEGGMIWLVGKPHRAQIYQFELFEFILLLESDKQFPVEQFEAMASRSTVPSPPLRSALRVCFPPIITSTIYSFIILV